MEANNVEVSRFWTYLSGLLTFEAPLWNWRQQLGNDIDFEHFRETYLLPTNKIGSLIICPKRCDYFCGFRKIRKNDGGAFRAVCHKNKKDSFPIAEEEVLIYGVNYGVLLPKTALVLGIQPLIAPFQTWEDAWKMGTLRLGNRILPVFFTLRNWNHKVIDLILNLNRTENRPYILLLTSAKVISPTSLKALEDSGSLFLPLNEVLDFNRNAEPVLVRPLDSYFESLLVPPSAEPEPENIFRRCGDAWEVRFAGGEKFMLTGANTGAKYIQYMLQHPNQDMPVVNIVKMISEVYALPDEFEDITNGFSINSLPEGNTGNVADALAIRQYLAEERELVREIEAAEDSGDNVMMSQLARDLKLVRMAISQAVSPAGQRKLLGDPELKVANAFRNSVNYAITRIERYDVELARHLQKTIKCGSLPEYSPENDIKWSF